MIPNLGIEKTPLLFPLVAAGEKREGLLALRNYQRIGGSRSLKSQRQRAGGVTNNIQKQIFAERLQSPQTREAAIREVQKYLDGRTLVTFFTSFNHVVEIDNADCDMLQSVLQHIDLKKGLALMIDSPGGDGLAAEMIVNTCRAYSGTGDYWAIVPGSAKSAASVICMGAS
jgi:ClpP class serine protease